LLGRPFKIEVDHTITLRETLETIQRRSGTWFGRQVERVVNDIKTRSQNPARAFLSVHDIDADRHASLHDVGFGLSQVLPVLVYALATDSHQIAIEQPELHVHPGAQADLADMFIEASAETKDRLGNRLLLETHSEHLILRVLRRIRETSAGRAPEHLQITASEVSVIFVSPGPDGAWVTYLPIDDDGEFTEPWPDGFLPDRLKEL
jgi:predicted ATPase